MLAAPREIVCCMSSVTETPIGMHEHFAESGVVDSPRLLSSDWLDPRQIGDEPVA